MEKKIAALLTFAKDSIDTKPSFGLNVVGKLNKNKPSYPALPVSITDLEKISNELLAGIVDARTGDHQAVAHRNNLEKLWDQQYKRTAAYVTTVANGDEELITGAGFLSSKGTTTPTPPPGQVINCEVNPVKGEGLADVSSDGANKAQAYAYIAKTAGVEVTFNGPTVEITLGEQKVFIVVDTHKKVLMKGLPSQPLQICMYAVNNAGTGPATDWQKITPQ